MKDWKIGIRITAGFAAVILIAAALGIFALNRAAEIGKKTDQLSNNYYPSVLALDRVKSNLYQEVADLLDLIQSSNPQEIAGLDAEIASLRADTKKDLDFYATTPFTPEEQAVDNEFEAARANFLKIFEDVQKDGQSTHKEDIVKAQQRFTNELKPAYIKYAALGQKLVEMNMKGANDGMDSIHAAVSASTRGVLIGLFLAITLSIPITIFIVRSITRPLALAVHTLEQVAAGDLTATLGVDSKDEVGQMAASLNTAVEKLRSTLFEVAEGAANTRSSSQNLADAVRELASGAQEQAASIEETSASLEQITATVRQSADNAKQANQLAAGSRESAEKGQDVVVGAVAAMEEINIASAKISEITSAIDEIAFQTNLLAVNAAVVAARAGEDGRGFAVVATEVRSLAARSAQAAKEIKSLIQDSLRKVERGSELVSKSGETLKGIVAGVKRVTDIVGEMASASAEQSTGVEQVNLAVTQMDQVTQTNAAQSEELSSTAQSLSEQAERLTELVATFQLGGSASGSFAAPRANRQAQKPKAGKNSALAKRGASGTAISVSAGKKTRSLSTEPRPQPSSTVLAAANDASFEEF
jgi:methyl-accepting chemotaxis protein